MLAPATNTLIPLTAPPARPSGSRPGSYGGLRPRLAGNRRFRLAVRLTRSHLRHSFVSLLSDGGVLIEHISRLVDTAARR